MQQEKLEMLIRQPGNRVQDRRQGLSKVDKGKGNLLMSYTVLDVNDINLNDDGIFCKILLEMELTNFSINNTYNKSTFVQSV